MDNLLPIITAVGSLGSLVVLVLALTKLGSIANQAGSRESGITAEDLGPELATAINGAFKAHVPDADKFASATSAAIEQAVKKSGESVQSMHQNLMAAQTQTAQQIAATEKSATQGVENAARALEAAGAKLNEALTAHVQQMEKAAAANRDQISAVLTQHAQSMSKASEAIAGQLDKIMQLEKEIQQVLHIQQVVDGSMKAVSGAEEFKSTLSALRTHLEKSDSLIREVTKPRTIRLVESDN
ncbi:MAG: hypothetical protein M5U15_11665 [Kiritimatiellae bacterium]|nr:hypothetical protein [Kiritimatiellia bacterium]